MQVFVIGSPWETAAELDKRRLNKQIIECQQILKVLNGQSTAWKNHPIVHMYRPYQKWLTTYMWILEEYALEKSDLMMLITLNDWCKAHMPEFMTQEYFEQMKRRLYTKDKNYYSQWSHLGESDVNWYYIDGIWKLYRNGKLVNEVKVTSIDYEY